VTRFEALVEVTLRPGIADPQGATIEKALPALGFDSISNVRAGKAFRLDVVASDEEDARKKVEDLCQRFLTNPVIENASITLDSR
jgi:phosphoribosylformylglycinamidine synthase PurS subunit